MDEEAKNILDKKLKQLKKNNQSLNYQEWILMTVDENKHLSDKNLDLMFRNFDYDNQKFITRMNMMEAFDSTFELK